jgi:hypothetical protein
MTLAYGTPEALPYVCALYTCRCGRSAELHGRHVAGAPRDWVVVAGDG